MNRYIKKAGSKNIYSPAKEPIKIVIPGRPVPKGRPRFGRGGNVYTPKRTREYEELVGWYAKQCIPEPLKGDIELHIKVYVKNNVFPDIDNIAKAIMDGLMAAIRMINSIGLTVQRIKGEEKWKLNWRRFLSEEL